MDAVCGFYLWLATRAKKKVGYDRCSRTGLQLHSPLSACIQVVSQVSSAPRRHRRDADDRPARGMACIVVADLNLICLHWLDG